MTVWEKSDWKFRSLTDTEGRYRVGSLPPGLFNVQAFAEGFQSKTEQVRIGEGERTILKIFLEREGR